MNMRRTIVVGVAVALAGATATVLARAGGADKLTASASLINDVGTKVGTVRFTPDDGVVVARAHVRLPASSPEFHGFHLHANAAGSGCEPGTGFLGVGGHWDIGGHHHGAHLGDVTSLQRRSDGTADLRVVIDKFTVADIIGKAVIVHAGPDNFANIPRGTASNQYTDNGTAFDGAGGTALTGNAGARYACGVISARNGDD